MDFFFKFSFLKILLLIIGYFVVLGIFSLQTIYYFSYHNVAGWVYLCVVTLAYIYGVYYLLNKPYSIFVLFGVAIIIGFIPYEETWKHALNLTSHSIDDLSAIGKNLMDIFFYPFLLFISFLFLSLILRSVH